MTICRGCNRETPNPKFCSRSCAATFNNQKYPKRKPEGSCLECGIVISTALKYCSRSCHVSAGLILTDEERRKRNSDFKLKQYHNRRASFLVELGGECVECGSLDRLEFDHINPAEKSFNVGSNMVSKSMTDLREELRKCQLLCRACHEAKTKTDLKSMRPSGRTPIIQDLETFEALCRDLSNSELQSHYGVSKGTIRNTKKRLERK